MAKQEMTSPNVLGRHDGTGHCAAVEAIVKGALESDVAISVMASPRVEPFAGVFRLGRDNAVREILTQHGLSVIDVAHAARAVDLAAEAAATDVTGKGQGGLAMIPNAHLADAISALRRAAGAQDRSRGGTRGDVATPTQHAATSWSHPIVFLFDDDPETATLCPRMVCRMLDIPCMEPADVAQLRDFVDVALCLSSSAGMPVGLVVHRSIMRSSDTLALHPNRAANAVDALLAQRAAQPVRGAGRPSPRVARSALRSGVRGGGPGSRNGDVGAVMRFARRVELNRLQRLPSPGEREPVGFVLVGPCTEAMAHILNALRMSGRVPILELGLLHPLDQPAVTRLLSRCEHVIVLEPRPGLIEPAVLDIAESMRRGPEVASPAFAAGSAHVSSGEVRPVDAMPVISDRAATSRPPALIWGSTLPSTETLASPEPSSHSTRTQGAIDNASPSDRTLVARPHEVVHPSLLARRVVHVLHMVRPSIDIAGQLAPEPDVELSTNVDRGSGVGVAGAMRHIENIIVDLAQWIAASPDSGHEVTDSTAMESDDGSGVSAVRIVLDGHLIQTQSEGRGESSASPQRTAQGASAARATRTAYIERFTQHRLLREGAAVVRQAARSQRSRVIVVCAIGDEDEIDLERFVRGAVPADRASRVRIETATLSQRAQLREKLRAAIVASVYGEHGDDTPSAAPGGLTVIIAGDPSPSQFDVRRIEQGLTEVDQLGFEPRQRMIWSMDRTCAIRLAADTQLLERAQDRDPELMHPQFSVDRLPPAAKRRMHMQVRPLFEQVEVVRTRPPLATWRKELPTRVSLPQPVHAQQPVWRAHLAGYRGAAPGVVASVLCDAGRRMGYHVRSTHCPTPIGPGRRAWTQILFTRPRNDGAAVPLTAATPFGEADVLLGLDWSQTLCAVGVDPRLRVADRSRTCTLANIGFFSDERQSEAAQTERDRQRTIVEATVAPDRVTIEDLAEACRASFHTDRVADVAALGMAFQNGWIPLTLESLEAALRRQEGLGYGRCTEAFEFGRRLAVNRKLSSRPRAETPGSGAENIDRLCRRLTLGMQRSGRCARRRATRFRHLLERTLALTPGLAETDAGRAARRDLVHGLYRATLWGGIDYAGHLADSVVRLYEADRGETGRAVTRAMILPLADANLIRDAVYIAALTRSSEQQRRVRQHLMIKLARGDVIERRFLTRFELIAFGRHIRADVRTSDWPARAIALLHWIVPNNWRGTRPDRRLRHHINDLAEQMARNLSHDYQRWLEVARDLHQRAIDDRLRSVKTNDASVGEGETTSA